MSSGEGPLGPDLPRRFGVNSCRYFRFTSAAWKAEEGRRFQYDGDTEQPGRTNEECTQAGHDAIHRMEVGRALTAPIQDHQLVLQEQRFCDYGTGAARAH